MANLITNKVVYSSDIIEYNCTIVIDNSQDWYLPIIVDSSHKCIIYFLKLVGSNFTQSTAESYLLSIGVTESNPKGIYDDYDLLQITANDPANQIKIRLESVGVTVLYSTNISDTAVELSILGDGNLINIGSITPFIPVDNEDNLSEDNELTDSEESENE